MIYNRISNFQNNILFVTLILLLAFNCCICWRTQQNTLNDARKKLLHHKNVDDCNENSKKSELNLHDYLEENHSEDREMDAWSFFPNPELGDHVEGDMIVENPRNGIRRTFMRNAQVWFEGIVPVYISPSIINNSRAFNVLLNSMKTIENVTDQCILFRPVDVEDIENYPTLPYVNITSNEPGCFSNVGRSLLNPTQTRANLNVHHCFEVPGHSLHELLHILGQTHEHMRPDRDKYVKIRWDNVRNGQQNNFRLLDTGDVETFNYPYDYDSVTHYSRTAFSKNIEFATIIPKQKHAVIGQRTHLSKTDVAKLMRAYKCQRHQKDFTLDQLAQLYQNQPISFAAIEDILENNGNSSSKNNGYEIENYLNVINVNHKNVGIENQVPDKHYIERNFEYNSLNHKSQTNLKNFYLNKEVFVPLPYISRNNLLGHEQSDNFNLPSRNSIITKRKLQFPVFLDMQL